MQLRQIDWANVDQITALSVQASQRSFVASNKDSLVDAYVATSLGGAAKPFGLYECGYPVGFVMIGYDTLGDEDEPNIANKNYCLWRFMIDQRYQSKGLGRMAMEKILEYLRAKPLGPAEYCWTSYEPENQVAKALYERFGFIENGELCGEEIVAVLKL